MVQLGEVIHCMRGGVDNQIELMVERNYIHISNTVDFFPHMCDNPIPTAQDRLNMILEELVEALGSPAPSIPSVRYGTDLNNAIRQL